MSSAKRRRRWSAPPVRRTTRPTRSTSWPPAAPSRTSPSSRPASPTTRPTAARSRLGAFAYDNVFLLERRRHQRQPVRQPRQPLHRGRDRGDAGADIGHLRRIRPLLGRRRQRGHQARRQQVLRQLPHRTSPTPNGRDETPFEERRTRPVQDKLRKCSGHVRRAGPAQQAVVLRRRALGGHHQL